MDWCVSEDEKNRDGKIVEVVALKLSDMLRLKMY